MEAAGDIEELTRRIRTAFTSGRLPEAVALLDEADRFELDEVEQLRFARVRAVTLSRAGRNADALAAVDGVADAWLERGDVHAAVSVSSMEAYIHHSLGQLDRALDTAARTLVLLDEIDPGSAGSGRTAVAATPPAPSNVVDPAQEPRLLIAATRNTLGLMFLDLEAIDLAIAEFSRVLELEATADPILAGIARGNLASAFLRKALRRRRADARIEGADEELAAAEELARVLLASDVPPRRQVEAATILAAVLHNTDRHDEATEVLEQHVEHEHLVDDARAMVDWNLLWARSHRLAGRHHDALERVERAIEFAARSSDRIAESLARRERSRVHEAMGDLRGALDDLRAADDSSRGMRSGRFEALVAQLMRRAGLEASRRRLEREAERLGEERSRLVLATETDPLTGVGNRRRLVRELTAFSGAPHGPISVLMIDVDRFKSFNDRWGHAFGDAVLTGVSATLASVARDGDVLCRPGGDEFVMLLPGASRGDARSVAERIHRHVGRLRWDTAGELVAGGPGESVRDHDDAEHAPGGIGISVSIGVASGDIDRVTELVGSADEELLEVKRAARDAAQIRLPLDLEDRFAG